jgi:hypothetical protein
MAKVVVYLRDQELNALIRLADQEYRAPKAQAALMLRTELERLGLLSTSQPTTGQEANHVGQRAC